MARLAHHQRAKKRHKMTGEDHHEGAVASAPTSSAQPSQPLLVPLGEVNIPQLALKININRFSIATPMWIAKVCRRHTVQGIPIVALACPVLLNCIPPFACQRTESGFRARNAWRSVVRNFPLSETHSERPLLLLPFLVQRGHLSVLPKGYAGNGQSMPANAGAATGTDFSTPSPEANTKFAACQVMPSR